MGSGCIHILVVPYNVQTTHACFPARGSKICVRVRITRNFFAQVCDSYRLLRNFLPNNVFNVGLSLWSKALLSCCAVATYWPKQLFCATAAGRLCVRTATRDFGRATFSAAGGWILCCVGCFSPRVVSSFQFAYKRKASFFEFDVGVFCCFCRGFALSSLVY